MDYVAKDKAYEEASLRASSEKVLPSEEMGLAGGQVLNEMLGAKELPKVKQYNPINAEEKAKTEGTTTIGTFSIQ